MASAHGYRSTAHAFIAIAVAIPISSAVANQPGDVRKPVQIGVQCPDGAIAIAPGADIPALATKAGSDASFCLQAGVHRTNTIRPKTGQKFFGQPGSILNGARLVTKFGKDNGLWTAKVIRPLGRIGGTCKSDDDICADPMAAFLNDKPLQQVAKKSDLQAGHFFYDRKTNTLVIADDPTGARLEATAVCYAFAGTATSVLLAGLTIEKFCSPAQESPLKGDPSGWTVRASEFRFNSGVGASVGSNGRIENSKIHHNGQLGITAGGADIVIENNEIYNNNIYGFDYDWEGGGAKITESSDVVYRGNHVHHNKGPGLWCDHDCKNAIFENNTVEFNAGMGIFFEISYGAKITNNTLRENGTDKQTWFWGANIMIAASQDAIVTGNVVTVHADGQGIVLVDQNRLLPDGSGFYKTQRNIVQDNVIHYLGEGASGGLSDADKGEANYAIIETGKNSFNRNTYCRHSDQPALFAWGHDEYAFTDFQKLGQERDGVLIAKGTAASDHPDCR